MQHLKHHSGIAYAMKFVKKHQQGEFLACISPQILLEFYAVVTNSKFVTTVYSPKQARLEIEKYLHSSIVSLYPREGIIDKVMELAVRHNISKRKIFAADCCCDERLWNFNNRYRK